MKLVPFLTLKVHWLLVAVFALATNRRSNEKAVDFNPYTFSYSLVFFRPWGCSHYYSCFLIFADMWLTHTKYNIQDYSNRKVPSEPFPSAPYQQPIKDYPSKPESYGKPENYSEIYSGVSNTSLSRTPDKSYNFL